MDCFGASFPRAKLYDCCIDICFKLLIYKKTKQQLGFTTITTAAHKTLIDKASPAG